MRKSVTIKDVALDSGVSFKTVSRVVNGVDSVASEFRDKVNESIKKLGYKPNSTARSLRAGHSYTIGLVYDEPKGEVQKGVLDQCKKSGFALQIHPCDPSDESYVEELLKTIKQFQLAGIILTPPLSDDPKLLRELAQNNIVHIRIISSNTQPDYNWSCIYINDKKAGYDLTNHLFELGHRNIGFLKGNEEHRSSHERYAGFVEAHENLNISVDESLVFSGKYSFESGLKGARALLSQKKKPTAIICSNDEMAAGALIGAQNLSISVPDALSIAGFEDSSYSRQAWPAITTVSQNTVDIAASATLSLISCINSQNSNRPPKDATHIGYTPTLIVRDSTGAANNR